MNAKAALRTELLGRRATRSAQSRVDAGNLIAERIIELTHSAEATAVALYLSTEHEPPTWHLADRLVVFGVRVLAPVTTPGNRLDWAEYVGPDAVHTAAYGIAEPTTPRLGPNAVCDTDLIVVPALAADSAGGRLGRGAGYYDRALADLDPGKPRVAVVFDDELMEHVPTEPHDVPVDQVVTPTRTVVCRPGDDPAGPVGH